MTNKSGQGPPWPLAPIYMNNICTPLLSYIDLLALGCWQIVSNPLFKQGGALALFTALHTEHKLGEQQLKWSKRNWILLRRGDRPLLLGSPAQAAARPGNPNQPGGPLSAGNWTYPSFTKSPRTRSTIFLFSATVIVILWCPTVGVNSPLHSSRY